jgi:prepilin-type N-terminal cleavage/methylation domain-containing protein
MTTQYASTNGNNGTWTNGKRGGKRAFTLIEILIVVVILGVLAALVVPSVTSALDDAKTEAAEARGSQILTMVTRFNQFPPGGASISLPSSAGAITTTELDKLVTAGYCESDDITNQLTNDSTWFYDPTTKTIAPE